jgi:hypothetical protein
LWTYGGWTNGGLGAIDYGLEAFFGKVLFGLLSFPLIVLAMAGIVQKNSNSGETLTPLSALLIRMNGKST